MPTVVSLPFFVVLLWQPHLLTALQLSLVSRRSIIAITGATSLSWHPGDATANNAGIASRPVEVSEQDAAAFSAIEKVRVERERRLLAERNEFEAYLKKIDKASTASEFAGATDELSLYIIGKGSKLSEGINTKLVVNRVRLAYVEFNADCPETVKACNLPKSAEAKAAFQSFLGVLRTAAPKNANVGSGSNGALRAF